ncbi:alpha/beta hydrolase [Leptospira sp. 2 VSF19]|uniref:Alpha/beta hydrolase n=1 Tax=Leptospira soteropolitanensis TaxID=2950025 RepID=A0AAW5VIK7_9LEPT|nr:alpha/beta hydrolase [Leptospira soteropolitanensis]MCW7494784.1 alpha/beta hydrolase [Leptospira soteropolitanensis]MCW7502374.1 alpha/beta hydrolase [Leptospira soteropolitanensis]MCW7524610.1 alpha/beta hydrolase [Leptospira soteropolitanensis]MCW7528471.1 alpha/beta hydrolase [Leptospira soteropolitanensis]MCW7532340.1 alpha/beta hydrolase [Leptospira soteropolitanensis]
MKIFDKSEKKMRKQHITTRTVTNKALNIQAPQMTEQSVKWRYVMPAVLSASIALMLSGCATPITVDHVDLQTSQRISSASALSTDAPSEASSTVLRQHGLLDRFESEPSLVLAELHKGLSPTDDDDQLFALAELSLLHAQRTHDRAYFLASAVYAWSLLFPENGTTIQLHPSDPRFRLTYDIYNQALAQGFAAQNGQEDEVTLKSGTYKLPFGTLRVKLDESGMSWGGYKLDRFISTAALAVDGLRNRYHKFGIGVPLAASIAKAQTSGKKVLGSERIGLRTKVPVTALLRLENARNRLSSGKLNGQLEVYAADQTTTVMIDGQKQPMESDASATFAYQLDDSPLYAMEIAGFLNGGILSSGLIPKDRAQDGIFTLQPYKAGKIPIVLVHGTASSPLRWAELVNELNGNAKIREHYQIWVFMYDSGNMIPYSAGRLRKALTNTLHEFDPEGKDPALQQMIVIGHSQGGLLTKTTVIDNGTQFWNLISNKPFEQVKLNPEARELLQQSLFYKPLPFVKRVVFISTPQRGAMLAAYQVLTDLAAKLIKFPVTVMSELKDVATVTGDERLTAILRRPPTAIDNMNPDNRGLKILASIPVAAVPAHSIIAVQGDGPKEEGDDGVVAYKSAHIDEAVSEFVVRWNHSCQGQPEVIEEVKRILFEHLAASETAKP